MPILVGSQQADDLPYICPEHPDAQIRHEWAYTRTRVHLTGAEWGYDHDHRYYCAECGRELLSSPPESGPAPVVRP